MTDSAIEQRMTLVEHLRELRSRVFRALLAIVVVSIVAFVLWNRVSAFLLEYYRNAANDSNRKFPLLSPLDGLGNRLTVSGYIGLFGSSPVWLWEVWRFITPGLNEKEKRYAVPFVLSSVLLFVGGAAVAMLTLPKGLEFLVQVGGNSQDPFWTLDKFVSLLTLMVLAFGFSFLFPVVLVFLELVNLVTPRQLLERWRYAIVIIFVIAAVITPSQDPFTLFAMAVPMIVFYFIAILIGRLLKK
jgi:sec-independent protein translocase protein TatC